MDSKFEILLLTTGWLAFGIWEYFVELWLLRLKEPIIRIDLFFIFPGLLLLTIWMIYNWRKTEKGDLLK